MIALSCPALFTRFGDTTHSINGFFHHTHNINFFKSPYYKPNKIIMLADTFL